MTEQLISFSTAKLAKKKGFDWETKLGYCTTNDVYPIGHVIINTGYDCLLAPTQSLLQRWLREETLVEVFVEKYVHRYRVKAINYDGDLTNSYTDHFTIYEKALEMGLKKALKLITKTKKP